MIITVIKKDEIEFTDKEIEEFKKNYNEDPELFYNLGDKEEFLKNLNTNGDFYEEYIDVEEKSYNEFLEKWNRM